MMGTVAGEPKKIITNISCVMSHMFIELMKKLLQEANEGAFTTKGQAVLRRDDLLTTPAAEAGGEQQAATAAASELDGRDID